MNKHPAPFSSALREHKQWTQPNMISDCVNEKGKRLTTFVLRYPKMVHGDFMTHRVFSRNASSSRAIPTAKLAMWTTDDPYTPLFRTNKPGMQAGEYLSDEAQAEAAKEWNRAADECLLTAKRLSDPKGLNVHKQWTNRMLEWFGYINVQVTATDYRNFIALREELDDNLLPMAQDEIYYQATGIKKLLDTHEPRLVRESEWAMPWIKPEEESAPLDVRLKLSAARSASISYKTVDGHDMTYDRALAVYDKLVAVNHRMHASPLEHQGLADPFNIEPQLHGNFSGGWIQYRKLIPGEFVQG